PRTEPPMSPALRAQMAAQMTPASGPASTPPSQSAPVPTQPTTPPSQPTTPPSQPTGRDASSAIPRAPSALAELINQERGGLVPPIPNVGFGSFKLPPYREKPGDKVVPFTRRRRITADHMVYSKLVSPHVVTVAECDLHQASRLREAHKDRYKKE